MIAYVRSARRLARVALVLALAALPATASEREALDERIALDLEAANPAEVFASLARILGGQADVDSAVNRSLTIRLSDVRVRVALDAACDALRCTWQVIGSVPDLRLRIVAADAAAEIAADGRTPAHPGLPAFDLPVSIDLVDAALGEVLAAFATMLEARIDVEPDLAESRITIRLAAVPVGEALEAICASARCAFELVSETPLVVSVFAAGR